MSSKQVQTLFAWGRRLVEFREVQVPVEMRDNGRDGSTGTTDTIRRVVDALSQEQAHLCCVDCGLAKGAHRCLESTDADSCVFTQELTMTIVYFVLLSPLHRKGKAKKSQVSSSIKTYM